MQPPVPEPVQRLTGGQPGAVIDEVRVWDRALSDSEIADVHQTHTGPDFDNVLWLPMDQVAAAR
ncbi:hypothetical protein [Streptomyces sp. NPDC000851]